MPISSKKLHILVSNDDGYSAPGINVLRKALSRIARVTVVAPDREQSGTGHSLSLHRPLRITKLDEGYYCVDGTPTDCVYVALTHILKDDPPDLVASGINAGPNMGSDLTYSGTVAAAMEACVFGVPAFAISLAHPQSDKFVPAGEFACRVAPFLATRVMPKDTFLNINVPVDVDPVLLPWETTFLGNKEYERTSEIRRDPRGVEYLWIGGPYLGADHIPGSDCTTVASNIISVTPVTLDLTARELLDTVKGFPFHLAPGSGHLLEQKSEATPVAGAGAGVGVDTNNVGTAQLTCAKDEDTQP